MNSKLLPEEDRASGLRMEPPKETKTRHGEETRILHSDASYFYFQNFGIDGFHTIRFPTARDRSRREIEREREKDRSLQTNAELTNTMRRESVVNGVKAA